MTEEPSIGLQYIAQRGLGALADRMGISISEFSPEFARASMPVDGNTQPLGLVHGGAYVVLGETLGSMCANMFAPEGKVAVGIEINATHSASATTGHVHAECTALHLGSRLTTHEIVVRNDAGARCSTIRITNMIIDRPKSASAS